MMAALILVLSVTALVQFFVWYCHALIRASRRVELSPPAREITGIGVGGASASASEFGNVLQLVRVCPESGNDETAISAVRAYYELLGGVRDALGWSSRDLANWLEGERGGCAYFAAVALDRRIIRSRALLAQLIFDG